MASKKLTDLISGGPVQNGDKVYVVRGSDSRQATIDVASSAQGVKADNSVQGISSSTANEIMLFDGVTGKQVKSSGTTIAGVLDRSNHTGTQSTSTVSGLDGTLSSINSSLASKASTAPVTTSANGLMIASDKSKLDGIATGATANASDASLRDRTTHTGTQAISTVSGLQTALDTKLPNNAIAPIKAYKLQTLQGNASGTVTLNVNNFNVFGYEIIGNTTFVLTGTGISTDYSEFIIGIANGGAFTVNWPASFRWPGGTAAALTNGGTDIVSACTFDGGATWYASLIMKDVK